MKAENFPTSNLPPEESQTCNCNRSCWIGVFAIFLLLIGITGLTITCFVLEQKVLQSSYHYGVVFDAGSTHTGITIYRWPVGYKNHGTALIDQLASETCSDAGITSYEHEPEMAGEMIKKCIDNVVLRLLSQHAIKKTAIYFGATAGMRLLCERDQEACYLIEESIRRNLNKYKFRETKNRVKILTGNEESAFGWISANIVNGALLKEMPPKSNPYLVGSLDMGGGSAEIAFIPENITIPEKYSSKLSLYGLDYTLYTHSYLCFGFKEAQRRLMANLLEASNFSRKVIYPCWQKGYNETISAASIWLSPCSVRPKSMIFPLSNTTAYNFVGNGSSSACLNRIKELFYNTTCQFGTCSFDGVFQPPLRGHFMAFSGYGHVGTFFNITKGDAISEIKTKGDDFCKKDWSQVSKDYPNIITKFLKNYCFESLYSYGFLTSGLHFKPESNDVHIRKEDDGTQIGWSLGFMVNATNSVAVEEPSYRLSRQEYIALLTFCCLVIMLGLAMLIGCFIKRRVENKTYKYSRIEK
ncbi:ectonucleoside triphosphate diphosphohydrolase 8 [Hydra vulgaris]|uniref:Ectonucleoside triphosphate diphosphohydrolase 8 n=1 Tax=Hydra vulgaris TaxID=6087 RepID=A0ABM4BKQ0_HYDVU